MCVFGRECEVIGILPQKEKRVRVKNVGLCPSLVAAGHLRSAYAQTESFIHILTSPLILLLIWIYNYSEATSTHSVLMVCINWYSVAMIKYHDSKHLWISRLYLIYMS